jgi:hypothetical protein
MKQVLVCRICSFLKNSKFVVRRVKKWCELAQGWWVVISDQTTEFSYANSCNLLIKFLLSVQLLLAKMSGTVLRDLRNRMDDTFCRPRKILTNNYNFGCKAHITCRYAKKYLLSAQPCTCGTKICMHKPTSPYTAEQETQESGLRKHQKIN